MRKETDRKAKALYDFAAKSSNFEIFVENPNHRSATVVVLNCKGLAGDVIKQVQAKSDMILGSGYGKMKETQIRIANFPAVNFEQVQALIATLGTL